MVSNSVSSCFAVLPVPRIKLTHRSSAHVVRQTGGLLCLSNNRYNNGKLVEPSYVGDRSFDHLSTFIDEHSQTYAARHLEGERAEEGGEAVFEASRPNADGKVADVDEEGLKALREKGAVLTEYFAPWCGQ